MLVARTSNKHETSTWKKAVYIVWIRKKNECERGRNAKNSLKDDGMASKRNKKNDAPVKRRKKAQKISNPKIWYIFFPCQLIFPSLPFYFDFPNPQAGDSSFFIFPSLRFSVPVCLSVWRSVWLIVCLSVWLFIFGLVFLIVLIICTINWWKCWRIYPLQEIEGKKVVTDWCLFHTLP